MPVSRMSASVLKRLAAMAPEIDEKDVIVLDDMPMGDMPFESEIVDVDPSKVMPAGDMPDVVVDGTPMCPCAGEPAPAPAPGAEKEDDDKDDDKKKDEKEDEKDDERDAAVRLAQFRELRAMRRRLAAGETAETQQSRLAKEATEEKKEQDAAKSGKTDSNATPEAEGTGTAKSAEVTWAPLVSAEDMVAKGSNVAVDMTLRAADTDAPFYVMWLEGHPFGEIHLADVDTDEGLREVFVNDAFVRGVRETVAACGPADAFETLRVRYYAAATNENDAIRKAKAEIATHADASYRQRAASLKGNLIATLHLAMEASRKNFILENPLKDSLVENMRKAGMSERVAIDIIEDAFVKSGDEYLRAMVAKADEWLGYEPEALKQIENTVVKMSYVHPLDLSPVAEEIPAAQPTFQRAAMAPMGDPSLDADAEAALRVIKARKRSR